MFVSKKKYKELEKAVISWKIQTEKAIELAQQIAEVRDECFELVKYYKGFQEPKKTVEEGEGHMTTHSCPTCGKFICFQHNTKVKFCNECGQRLKYVD